MAEKENEKRRSENLDRVLNALEESAASVKGQTANGGSVSMSKRVSVDRILKVLEELDPKHRTEV